MADSKQLAILKALSDHIAGMTVDDGYGYDMADAVFRGRAMFGAEMPLPCVSIIEAPRPDESPRPYGESNVRRIEDWVLLVQGWAQDDPTNPTDPVYDLKAHVERRLSQLVERNVSNGLPAYPSVYRLGGLIVDMAIGPGVVSPPRQNVSDKAFFYLPVVVKATFSPASPFVQ